MKPVFTFFILALIVCSCKKEGGSVPQETYLQAVKKDLKDSLGGQDYATLDFSKAVLNKVDSAALYFLRIPFKGSSIAKDFVIAKTLKNGTIVEGKIIQLSGGIVELSEGSVKNGEWEGKISLSSLNRKEVVSSEVHKGYIEAFHKRGALRQAGDPVYGSDMLPEVVVVAYVRPQLDNSFSTWIWLNSFFYSSIDGGGGGSGYYGSLDGGGGYTGSGGTGGYGGSYDGGDYGALYQDPTIELEPEYIYDLPVVDLTRMFNCFDYVPSPGARYSIKLCTDIPSNSNPAASSNSSGASSGHTFLTVTKTNGASSVAQSFGFYPASALSWSDPFASVSSNMRNNGEHEINASIEMDLSESQFYQVKKNAIQWAAHDYALADYNCTNYALDIFNSVRSSPIAISAYKVVLPVNTNPWAPSDPIIITINKSPQMLFSKLQEMRTNGGADASRIVIDRTHGLSAPASKGECN